MNGLLFRILLSSLVTFPVLAERKPPATLHAWQCYRRDNPWIGLTDSAEAEGKTKHVRAARKANDKRNLVKPLPGTIAGNDYILMRLPDAREVTVNAAYFSDLDRVDVTRKLSDRPVIIGKASAAARRKFSPMQILQILVQYQIIQTYIHAESTVHLIKEAKSGNQWSASVQGQHIFYTNEKNVEEFSFTFYLDLESGEMSVAALK